MRASPLTFIALNLATGAAHAQPTPLVLGFSQAHGEAAASSFFRRIRQ